MNSISEVVSSKGFENQQFLHLFIIEILKFPMIILFNKNQLMMKFEFLSKIFLKLQIYYWINIIIKDILLLKL